MKSFSILILFICIMSLTGVSQTVSLDTIPSATFPASASPVTPKKLHLNIQAGTQFWSASGFGSGFDSFIMTGLSYPLGKRFSIEGGIGIVNSSFTAKNHSSSEFYGTGNGNQTHTLVYVTGNYLLSQHLTVSGTLFKDFISFNNSGAYQYNNKDNPQGLYMKVNYKINDFMQIEAGFGYSKGVNPYDQYLMCYPGYGGSFLNH
ncbi:MAG: hypothetical protein NTX61_16835 [Bacteroidetes bacterium]|nr:hypothetical protein [Bacteroidota bacterium]